MITKYIEIADGTICKYEIDNEAFPFVEDKDQLYDWIEAANYYGYADVTELDIAREAL